MKALRAIPGLLLDCLLFCLVLPFLAAYYVCYGLWIVIRAVYRLW